MFRQIQRSRVRWAKPGECGRAKVVVLSAREEWSLSLCVLSITVTLTNKDHLSFRGSVLAFILSWKLADG